MWQLSNGATEQESGCRSSPSCSSVHSGDGEERRRLRHGSCRRKREGRRAGRQQDESDEIKREERRKEKGTMGRSEHRFEDGGKSW